MISVTLKSTFSVLKAGLSRTPFASRYVSVLSSSLWAGKYKLIDHFSITQRNSSFSFQSVLSGDNKPVRSIGSSYHESEPTYTLSRMLKGQQRSISASSPNPQTGKKQSPINIITSNTIEGSKLKPLIFSPSWDKPVTGTVENTGYYLKFTAESAAEKCRLTTYNGEYILDHFHYHWGKQEGEGAEHHIDGKQYDIEFHFVHRKVGVAEPDARDSFAVLGVFGKAEPLVKIRGIWELLSPLNVLDSGSKHNVADVTHSNLLPQVKDYFHYEGSLTTPSYDEVVHWYVLKEPIPVPSQYLEELRQMKADGEGRLIDCNFRGLQEIYDRAVQRFEGGESELEEVAKNKDVVDDVTKTSSVFISELVRKIDW